jgi:hypothetical protein
MSATGQEKVRKISFCRKTRLTSPAGRINSGLDNAVPAFPAGRQGASAPGRRRGTGGETARRAGNASRMQRTDKSACGRRDGSRVRGVPPAADEADRKAVRRSGVWPLGVSGVAPTNGTPALTRSVQ